MNARNDLLIEPMLEDYTADMTPGWTHTNDGHHIVINGQFGQLEVGKVPGKSWDQWLFQADHGHPRDHRGDRPAGQPQPRFRTWLRRQPCVLPAQW
jgi:hypothetical protein